MGVSFYMRIKFFPVGTLFAFILFFQLYMQIKLLYIYRRRTALPKGLHDRLRKWASILRGKEKEKWVSLLKFITVCIVIKDVEWSLQIR